MAKYASLKDDENSNFFEKTAFKIWIPSIVLFQHKADKTLDFGTKMLVQKNLIIRPTLSAGIDSIDFQEVYSGRDLKYITKQRVQFLCQFDYKLNTSRMEIRNAAWGFM